MENAKAKIFIGSASEGIVIADAIAASLNREFAVNVWPTTVKLSQYLLDSLVKAIGDSDFCIFVFSPEDQLTIRGMQTRAVRDNVLFEAGLSVGLLGIPRTFIVAPMKEKHWLASDLLGIQIGEYDESRIPHEAEPALRTFCSKIAGQMKTLGRRPETPPVIKRLTSLAACSHDSDVRFHTFCGQRTKPINLVGDAALFDRETVFRLWADPKAGNTIQATLGVSGKLQLIRIQFANKLGSLPGDVTVRPLGFHAMTVSPDQRFLAFDLRAPRADWPRSDNAGTQNDPAIAVRLIDAQATQWSYQNGDTRHIFDVPVGDDWRSVFVDLQSKWCPFEADGNHYYRANEPDFSTIAAIVVEVGTVAVPRPGSGAGVIELARIRLCSEGPEDVRLKTC